MSHIVEIKTEVHDAAAVAAACRRLGLAEPVHGTAEVYATSATGLLIQLPDWNYPVVCDLASGTLKYDNFSGSWGDQKELDRFLQAYAAEKAKLEARKEGHTVYEQSLEQGFLKLSVHVGGAT